MSPSQISKIASLALVAKFKSGYKEGNLYAGWSAGGVPILATSEDALADAALRALDALKASGIQLQMISITSLAVADFNFVGPIFDFSDASSISLTEDVMEIGLVDSLGQQTTLKFGEMQLLNAITSGVMRWQFVPSASISELVVKSVFSYSLLVPGKRGKVERDTLIIFRPILQERGNEIEFAGFLRDIVGRLIALDEQQLPDFKKGYLEASSGGVKKTSIWDLIVAPTADGQHFDPTRALLKAAGQLGLLDTRGLPLEEKANLLKEGLGKTDLPTLIKIASAMYRHASEKIR